ncbi:MAG: LptF/LptG family permease [Kiritimatiellia bacterium]|jgi:lipopolysaccharide export system permease protein|nr:LptF/LptG family permease [Kiritimatiellia bacterium]MDP6809622.1 LptF/LptG family permease [Kiritimatiellia bacterium]MDP7023527.1 LptF/LptG family permease [Kiritimatiellia bacterium]
MKILDRYLLREYLVTVFYCVAGLALLQIVYDLVYHFSKLIAAKITLAQGLRYYLGSLAPHTEFMLPAGILLATLYTLWQLSRHGELTAMRASGISLNRIMLPFLLVGLVFTAATALLKEIVAPESAFWAQEFEANKFKEPEERLFHNLAYYNAIDRRMWMIGRTDLKKPNIIHDVRISEERPDRTLERDWQVGRGEWLDQEWWFFDVTIQAYNEEGNPMGEPLPVPGSEAGIEMSQWLEKPADFETEVTPTEFMTTRDMLRYLRRHPDISDEALAQKRVDLHLRMAMPWACLIVTLFGIPAGARTARQSVINGVLTTLLFFVIFYALTQAGVFLAKRELLPPLLGAWLSNIVFLVAGFRTLMLMK